SRPINSACPLRSGLLQEAEIAQPLLEPRGPFAEGLGVLIAHAKAVARAGVNVQFRRDAHLFELQIYFGHPLRDVGAVAVAAHNKDRRRVFGWSEAPGTARINQRLKIRL